MLFPANSLVGWASPEAGDASTVIIPKPMNLKNRIPSLARYCGTVLEYGKHRHLYTLNQEGCALKYKLDFLGRP